MSEFDRFSLNVATTKYWPLDELVPTIFLP